MIDKKLLEIALGFAIENLVDSAALEPPFYPQEVIDELVKVVLSVEEGYADPYDNREEYEDYDETEYDETGEDEFFPDGKERDD